MRIRLLKRNSTFAALSLSLLCGACFVQGLVELPDVCWRDIYSRGVGIIPPDCEFDDEKQDLACYEKCKANYTGASFVCWQTCPEGFRDVGPLCGKPLAYHRGPGYGCWDEWKCKRDWGECEKWGLLWYPRCKSGFHSDGCCICSPDCPEGMHDIGTACTKGTYGRKGLGARCPYGWEDGFGLCYENCWQWYKSLGPLCRAKCHGAFPVECGGLCARSMAACNDATFDKVLSIAEFVANVVTILSQGTSLAAEHSARMSILIGVEILEDVGEDAIKSVFNELARNVGMTLNRSVVDAWAKGLRLAADDGEVDWSCFDPRTVLPLVHAYGKVVCGVQALA